MIDIEFVTASHDPLVLNAHLKQSPIIKSGRYDLTVMMGYTSVPEAYNKAKPVSDLVCYIHHDVYLPANFEADLIRGLKALPPGWGVVGVAGARLINGKKCEIGHISDRGRAWGSASGLPARVDTLDEMLLITPGGVRFDPQFEQDFYGADICLQARVAGRKNYAIDAYCEHNSSRTIGGRTTSFFESEKKFREKWTKELPIVTTCSVML